MRKEPPIIRFWRKVIQQDGCWAWDGSHDTCGYGCFYPERPEWPQTIHAHRFMYILQHGQIAKELDVCHSCDNRGCVNPTHLFVGTTADNMLDMAKKKRHPRHKLSHAAVLDIRARVANGELQYKLAQEYGVSKAAICNVVKRKFYQYLTRR
jgi:hypothetical protein